MVLWYAAELPETELQSFGKRLEAFGEAQADGFDIGIGENEVEEEVRNATPLSVMPKSSICVKSD